MTAIWNAVWKKYGSDLTTTSVNETLPAGSETVLLRTFGVACDDGTFRDSGIPEELLRSFKYERQTYDPTTSDLRGTILHQYKMRRRRVLYDPKSLGLQKVSLDDRSFVGFFRDAPDVANSHDAVVGSVRYNCIGCHSELMYGLNSVFSLRRNPKISENDKLLGGNYWSGSERVEARSRLSHRELEPQLTAPLFPFPSA